MRRLAGLVVALVAVGAAPARADLTYVSTWGAAGSGQGQFDGLSGIAVTPSGSVVTVESGGRRVQQFTYEGAFLRAFGQFARPEGVAVDATGHVYVLDAGAATVNRFDADGNAVTSWGTTGSLPGQFNAPRAIAVSAEGEVLVADTGNRRVQRFTLDGAYLGSIATPGDPTGVAAAPGGETLVTDATAPRIRRYGADGAQQTEWGSGGGGSGQFAAPQGVAVDLATGSVLVADAGNNRVQEFSFEGAFLSATAGPGMNAPRAIATDGTGAVFVADAGNARVLRFSDPAAKLPPPELGVSVNVAKRSGEVFVRSPGAAPVPLVDPRQIKIGSTIDATAGRVSLVSARDSQGRTQTVQAFDGAFTVQQERRDEADTRLVLTGGRLVTCKPGRASIAQKRRTRKRRLRRLWGDGSGNFRTVGGYGSAGVRGTRWLTEDRCDGTFFRVTRGSISVRDDVKKRTVILRRGQTYLARPPR